MSPPPADPAAARAPDRAAQTSALERVRDLLAAPAGRRESPGARSVEPGYVDLLGGSVASTGRAQDLMLSGIVPRIYERWWRPALGRALKGPFGPSMAGEQRLARELLGLESGAGQSVLDIACGTGNFSRGFGHAVGPEGLVVGIDVSETMLARAVADTSRAGPDNVAYVRGDAERLPFAGGSFDAVCCFAALHLFSDPLRALASMRDVLRPGGRLALLISTRHSAAVVAGAEWLVGTLSGMRIFGPGELRGALRMCGFVALEWQLAGAAQIVGARRAT